MLVCSAGFLREMALEIESYFENRARFVIVEDKAPSILEHVEGIHALIGCPRPLFSEELLAKARKTLQWIHVPGSGCEEFLIPSLVESEVRLTNGKIIQGPSAADHAVALLLCLTRNLHYVLRPEEGPRSRPIELRGRTALIVGCGGIGTLIGECLASFGMRIWGVTPEYVPMLRLWKKLLPPEELAQALPLADAVILSAPLTPSTEKIMGEKEFARMKPGAYFINVARGKLVETQALTEALQRGALQGAGLDVTDPEPLPEEHPLRKMPQVIVSPHIAGPSDKNRRRSFQLIRNNIERFVSGKPLINGVDKRRGY